MNEFSAGPDDVWAAPAAVHPPAAEWVQLPTPVPSPRPVGQRLVALTAWACCGVLLAASLLLLPVGLLALPVPVALATALAARGEQWPEALGLAPGVSAFFAFVAYRNRDHVDCPESGSVVLRPGQEFSCGGTAPEPWLVASLVLLAVAAAAYALALLAQARRARYS